MLSNVYEPRFEIGGGLWIQVRGWLINICLFSQTFLLFVFLAQQYWLGVSSCFLLAMLTLKCSVHLREMDRDFHQLPLTAAVLLILNKWCSGSDWNGMQIGSSGGGSVLGVEFTE